MGTSSLPTWALMAASKRWRRCARQTERQTDFVLNICLNSEGFQALPHILTNRDQQMMVIVEGRRPCCWFWKQLGHLSRICPQKSTINSSNSNINPGKTTCPTTNPALEPRAPPKKKTEERWTQVTRKRGKPDPQNNRTSIWSNRKKKQLKKQQHQN